MTLSVFEPTITTGERPQTHALDRAATGTGVEWTYWPEYEPLDFFSKFL